jgi:hypothetical protein
VCSIILKFTWYDRLRDAPPDAEAPKPA